MRILLILWISPMVLFWGWYFLSYYDMNFGSVYLSRELHDLVFELYGEILGVEPTTIPSMLANAIVLDSFILLAIIAFRRRKKIIHWVNTKRAEYRASKQDALVSNIDGVAR